MFRSPESDFLIKKVKEKNRECARTPIESAPAELGRRSYERGMEKV
jgi:hypothetical protein